MAELRRTLNSNVDNKSQQKVQITQWL
jgi:hypothetical protein